MALRRYGYEKQEEYCRRAIERHLNVAAWKGGIHINNLSQNFVPFHPASVGSCVFSYHHAFVKQRHHTLIAHHSLFVDQGL